MDRNAEYYYQSARHYLLPVERLDDIHGFVFKLGKKNYFFRGRETPFNNLSSSSIVSNKYCTNKLLEAAGIPVPKATIININEYQNGALEKKMASIPFPVVVKPTYGGLGKDVLCNVQTMEQLTKYLDAKFPLYEYLSIEAFHGQLKSYRVLVSNNRIIGILLREASHVVGDALHTVNELITLTNKKRAIQNDALAPITIDEECHICLTEQGLNLDYIPDADEKVRLGYTCNSSRGGIFTTVAINTICKENSNLMIRIAKLFNLNLVGIDVECENIATPIESSPKNVIIEANFSPSIKVHESPLNGNPNPVTKKIIRQFVFRHPLSYCYSLYQRGRTGYYIKLFISIVFLGLMYKL